MTRAEFHQLFLRALETAAENARARLGRPVPRSFLVELHAPFSAGRRMSVDRAADELYLGSDRFYRIIDVGIRRISPRQSIAFARVSGDPPGPFSSTWNPSEMGPFKQITAQVIEQV